jgi:hypothetical protein
VHEIDVDMKLSLGFVGLLAEPTLEGYDASGQPIVYTRRIELATIVDLGTVIGGIETILFNSVGVTTTQQSQFSPLAGFRDAYLQAGRMNADSVPAMLGLQHDHRSAEALTSLIQTALMRAEVMRNPGTFRQLFEICSIKKIDYGSPLTIEAVGVITGLTILPALMFYSCMRAIEGYHRFVAESEVRQTEVSIKKQELAQQEIRTQVLRSIRDLIEVGNQEHPLQISNELLAEVLRVNATPVAQLGSSPLIGSVSVGFAPHAR